MKVIAITGSRLLTSSKPVDDYLSRANPDRIIVGDCKKGVDKFAVEYARAVEIRCTAVAALWHLTGKPEGPIRNLEIAALLSDARAAGHECWAVAFPVSPEGVGGTWNCVRALRDRGFEPRIIRVTTKGERTLRLFDAIAELEGSKS